MFEKTREVVRKDRYGFSEEEFPHRAVSMGSPHAGLSRKELSLMTGCDPILAGDIQDNPTYNRSLPPSKENFLFTVTVTVDLLGGTRNLVCDGKTLYRLRATGVTSRAQAKDLCGRLKVAGEQCVIAD